MKGIQNVRTFEDLYIQLARMNKHNRKMVIICLMNRARQLRKEWAQSQKRDRAAK